SGIATIKSYTAEAHEVQRVMQESEGYRQSNKRAIVLSSAFVPLIRMAIMAGFIVIMVFGGCLAPNGQLNVGVYSVLVFLTQRLLWPLTRLGTTLDLYQRAMASTTRVMNLLQTEIQMEDGHKSLPVAQVRGEVAFEDVSFSYEGEGQEQPVTLRDLTLRVGAGETAAIVGPTGAGKSTVIKLLLRFYDVQEGRI